jgi:predicted amidohydrolase
VTRVRIASCAYPIEEVATLDRFLEKQANYVATAARGGAQLALFPEYGAVELTSALPAAERGELQRELRGMQRFLPAMIEAHAQLARQHAVVLLAPSFPELDAQSGLYHNRARLYLPSGASAAIDKQQMTRFEAELWGISPGAAPHVYETPLGTLGVTICYDSEFPLLVRRQVERGAEIILVPSCTDTLAGYHRVALSCRARALENQCYVVQSPTVSAAPWSLALDANHGAAAVYGPVDYGFAADGVIAQGSLDVPGWVFADLDLAALARVRADGQVRNHRDWSNPAHLAGQVGKLSLR